MNLKNSCIIDPVRKVHSRVYLLPGDRARRSGFERDSLYTQFSHLSIMGQGTCSCKTGDVLWAR
jgi:hypothetical protein